MSASYDDGLTSTEMNMSGPFTGDEDPRNRPKVAQDMSERVGERSEHGEEENNLPGRPREEPDDLGGEATVPGGTHDVQERPRRVRNECADETDAPG